MFVFFFFLLNFPVGVVCGEEHGYIVEYDGKETKVGRAQTNITVPEFYGGKNMTWSVRAYVGAAEGVEASCAVELCVATDPEMVTLGTWTKKQVGVWAFSWSNPNTRESVCGASVEYRYRVHVRNVETNVVVVKEETEETEVEVRVNETGVYEWSVVVTDGQRESAERKANVSLCVPKRGEAPVLEQPQDGDVYLTGELVELEWGELTKRDTQCGGTVNHTLQYWASGSADVTSVELGEEDRSWTLSGLDGDTMYMWAIVEQYTHWNESVRSGTFQTCTLGQPETPSCVQSDGRRVWWSRVEFGAVCGRVNETGYLVYVARRGTEWASAAPVRVQTEEYKVSGLEDGVYEVVVRAVNGAHSSDASAVVNVRVCTPTAPGVPVLWSPLSGAVMKLRDGVNFDVAKQVDRGKVCGTTVVMGTRDVGGSGSGNDESSGSNESSSENENPGRYELYIDDKDAPAIVFVEGETNTTTSYGREVYRYLENHPRWYGAHMWWVRYVNGDGLGVQSGVWSVYVCDDPVAPREMWPPDNATGVLPWAVLRWNISEDDFGHKCTANDGKATNTVRVYLERVNVSTDEGEAVNVSGKEPWTRVCSQTYGEASECVLEDALELGATYVWRAEVYNGYDSVFSTTHVFRVTDKFCDTTDCNGHGVCVEASKACACEEGYTGQYCESPAPKAKGSSVLGAALGGSLTGVVVIALIVALVLFVVMRKSGRKRVVLEGPGGDIRFSRVRVPSTNSGGCDNGAAAATASGESNAGEEEEGDDDDDESTAAVEKKVRADCERLKSGVAAEEAFVFGRRYRRCIIKGDGCNLDDTVKAALYVYYKHGCGRELLKYFIAKEVDKAQRPETLFRQNTAASTMFKHWSKIVGLDYLFACFSDVLKGLIQHEVDAANDRKSVVSLQLFNDTCEVDPLRIEDDEDVDQLLAVNAIQLSLTVQRFATQIFRSVTKIPYEIKDVCRHIHASIEAAYPGYGVRGVSAFLFLRFYCVSISVPEVYGLLKGKNIYIINK